MSRKHFGLLWLSLIWGCGGNSRDSLMTEQFDILKDAGEVLATVRDVESAKQAKPKLRGFGIRMQELEKKALREVEWVNTPYVPRESLANNAAKCSSRCPRNLPR